VRRYLIAGALALVSLWVLYRLFGSKKPESDQERVRATVTELADLASKKDVGEMMEHVSDAYRSSEGLGRDELKRYLAALLFRADWTEVVITRNDVVVEGPRATAEIAAVLARGRTASGDVDPGLSMGAHRITLRFERDGEEWKVAGSEHRPADVRELLGR
jgi:hypothetical protein